LVWCFVKEWSAVQNNEEGQVLLDME